jgi:hypothetical protein
MNEKTIEELFTEATRSVDDAYVARERAQRDRGAAALPHLREEAAHAADPFVRFMAKTLGAWIAGEEGADNDAATALLDSLPARFAPTPVREPKPTTTEQDLTHLYAGRLTRYLALRLVKEPAWPRWRREAALRYLIRHPDPACLPALARWAGDPARTDLDRPFIDYALDAIRAKDSQAVTDALAEETRFQQSQEGTKR